MGGKGCASACTPRELVGARRSLACRQRKSLYVSAALSGLAYCLPAAYLFECMNRIVIFKIQY